MSIASMQSNQRSMGFVNLAATDSQITRGFRRTAEIANDVHGQLKRCDCTPHSH
jgi:hypothetical protein